MPTINWRFAIVLCRFSDITAVPRPPGYYVDLFTQHGMGGVADYWRTVSCSALDFSGSKVFGWLTMNHVSSEVMKLTFPGDRAKLFQWGIDAARASGIDLSPYRSVIVVHNYGVDHGAVGGDGVLIVHQDPGLCEFGFICHEMGHAMGLPHSWSASPDFEYGDGWDLMSFATTTFQFPISFQGARGDATVGLNARNLEALGAMPPGRVWRPASADFSIALTLDPMNQPPVGQHGYLVAQLPANATRPARSSGSTYSVEFRSKAGWDRAIPENSVSIREIRTDRRSFLQPASGSRFLAGMEYVTPEPKVFVRVVSMDTIPTAALRIWDLPNGCVRREDSKPKVYLIENNTKRWVTSPEVLFAIGKTREDVRVVPDGALSMLPDGPDVVMPAQATVPWVRELGVDAAAKEVTDSGLKVKYAPRYIARSRVSGVDPPEGTKVPVGSDVTLTLTSGGTVPL